MGIARTHIGDKNQESEDNRMKLNGWKAYAGAAITALAGVNSALDYKLWPKDFQETVVALAIGLGIIGVRAAIGRQEKKDSK